MQYIDGVLTPSQPAASNPVCIICWYLSNLELVARLQEFIYTHLNVGLIGVILGYLCNNSNVSEF